jgi:Tol biopolymer transport system component
MPAWSADGRALYYWSRAENDTAHIFSARDLVSGVEREIIRRPFLGQLNVSPDGRWLATETIDASRSERVLLLISLETGTSREVMRVAAGVAATDLRTVAGRGARVYPTSWAADSRSFVARLQREPEGQSELWRVPVDETAPQRLSASVESHVFAFKVSPDGRHVAYRFKEPGPMPDAQVWSFSIAMTPNSEHQ